MKGLSKKSQGRGRQTQVHAPLASQWLRAPGIAASCFGEHKHLPVSYCLEPTLEVGPEPSHVGPAAQLDLRHISY